MRTHRSPLPLFVAATALPIAAAVGAAAFPEAVGTLGRVPWAACPAAAAAVVLPLGLFLLAFRDATRSSPARFRKAGLCLVVPVLFLTAGAGVVVFLQFGGIWERLGAFALWSLACALAPTLGRRAWSGGEDALSAPGRLGLALGAALLAYTATLSVAAGASAYTSAVAERIDFCRQTAEAESERLERDVPRTLELDAAVRSCATAGFRLAWTAREPVQWGVVGRGEWPVEPGGFTDHLVGG